MRSWTASAPGKLLLAGGYLVLESPHEGVVIGVDKRFYCTVVVHHHSEKSDNDDNNDNDNDNDNDNNNVIPILVQSPQLDQEWKYEWHCTDLTLHPLVTTNANGFIEKTLRVTLLALQLDNNNNNTKKTKNVSLLELILRGDNDFYSLVPHLLERNLPLTWSGAAQLPPFLPAPRRRSNANNNGHQELLKTGLGSSACLVTSVVAALVMALSSTSSSTSTSSSIPKLDDEEEEDQRAVNNDDKKNNMMNNKLLTMDETTLTTIFRLAQICHCHAQGKVGSGFDVAAACYGSHIYQRIPQSVLAPVLTLLEEENNEDDKHKHNHHPDRVLAIQQCLLDQLSMTNPLWTTKEQGGGVQAPLSIPSYIQVMLADVSGGSESPSMARTVLQWKEQQQQQAKTEANRIPYWDDLAQLNAKVGQLWQELSQLSEEPSMTEVESLANTPAHQWVAQATTTTPLRPFATTTITTTTTTTTESVTQRRRALLWELSQTLQETRRQLKAMGEAAQVPIEPNEQTALANATMALPGVIAALVPGAGGYDALACIYINTDSVRNAMDQLWSTWTWTWQGGGDTLDYGNGKNNDALRQAATVDRDPTTSVTIATGETSTNMASATNKVICPLTVQAISYGQGVQIVEHLTLPTNPA